MEGVKLNNKAPPVKIRTNINLIQIHWVSPKFIVPPTDFPFDKKKVPVNVLRLC